MSTNFISGVRPEEYKQIEAAVKENLKDKIASYERLKDDVERLRKDLERREKVMKANIALASAALRDTGHKHLADYLSTI